MRFHARRTLCALLPILLAAVLLGSTTRPAAADWPIPPSTSGLVLSITDSSSRPSMPPLDDTAPPLRIRPRYGPPTRLVIPAIRLNAPVSSTMGLMVTRINGQTLRQQIVPAYEAGWHADSALPGLGNTVLSGHHNIEGRVFANLVNVPPSATITLWSGDTPHHYQVSQKMILPEEGMPAEARAANGRWIDPSDDSRLTLVTCWPAWTNTHRLVVVAVDLDRKLQDELDKAARQAYTERVETMATPQ